jgi:hypothetical protein
VTARSPGRTALARARAAWDRFFHAEGRPLPLALFRIAFAVALWIEVDVTRAKSLFAIAGGFHLPYLSLLPNVSEATFHRIHDLQYPCIVLLGLGLWMRLACGALLLLQGFIFFSDWLNFRNHPYLFLLLLLVLSLSRAAEALSVRALHRAWKEHRPLGSAVYGTSGPVTFQRLIQVEICLVYFIAGLHKLTPAFLSGEVLALYVGSSAAPWRPYLELFLAPDAAERAQAMFQSAAFQRWPAVGSAAIELLLPFALWFRRTRGLAIAAGIAFHVGIALLLEISTFTIVMIASYVLFLAPVDTPQR